MKRILHDLATVLVCASIAILFALIFANSLAPSHDRSHVVTVRDLLP